MQKEIVKEILGTGQIMLAMMQRPPTELVAVVDKQVELSLGGLNEVELLGAVEHVVLPSEPVSFLACY